MDFKFSKSSLPWRSLPGAKQVNTDPNATKLEHLPAEIHVKILSFVDLTDVVAYSSTCRLFYRYAESQQIW